MSDHDEEEPTASSDPLDLDAPIVFGPRVIEHRFSEEIEIRDPIADARRQPQIMASFGLLAVEARHRERRMRAELERVERGIEFELRSQLAVAENMAAARSDGKGRKPPRLTREQLRAQIIHDGRYTRKLREYLLAQREAEKLTLFEEVLRQRAAALGLGRERGRDDDGR